MQKTTPSPQGTPPVGPTAPQAPTPPPGGVIAAAADLGTLRAQLADLTVQRAALKAQWNGLQRQLESMRIDNPARPPVQQQAAQVGVQMAQIDGEIARIQAQIGVLQGRPGYGERPASGPPPRQFDPDLAAGLMFAFIFAVLMPISIAYARRVWRGRPNIPPAPDQTIAPRLDRLEQAVDAIAIEIERVAEGQRFVTKILAERPMNNGVAAPASSANEGQGMRALGAGPAEPIPLAERQKVSQRNTPS